jgi:prepilin peptidase CpaA
VWEKVQVFLFFFSLIIAAYTDLKRGCIPDWITLTVTVAAMILSFLSRGVSGFTGSLLGWSLGFAPFYILFRMGGMGGGDVKLMGMVGALGGAGFIIYCYWYTALVGLIMALGMLVIKGRFKEGFSRTLHLFNKILWQKNTAPVVQDNSHSEAIDRQPGLDNATVKNNIPLTIPYGIAIVAGAYITFFCKMV